MPKNVLVTGGAGFIGSHIVEELAKRGYNVVAYDNCFLGKPENVKPIIDRYPNRVVFIRGDVLDFELLLKVVEEYDINAVIHMAAQSSSPMFFPSPKQAIRVNLEGFLNFLELGRMGQIEKIVYASTSSLYSAFYPPHREDLPVIPRTYYEYSMFIREHLARIYYDYYGIECIGMRFFSIYGPREEHKGKFANMVSQFIWCILRGKSPIIFGNGTQTRDFTFVKDAALACILALEKKGLGAEVFNVGTGRETDFNTLWKLINEIMGTNIKAIYKPNPIKNYVYRTCADTRKAEKILGFKAQTDLETGIRITVEYYRKLFEKDPNKIPEV